MEKTQFSTNTLERSKEYTDPEDLASRIWDTIVEAYDDLSISQATVSISDSDIVLSYPIKDDLKEVSFLCCNTINKKEVLRIFSNIAGKSDIKGKIYCQNTIIKLVFQQ